MKRGQITIFIIVAILIFLIVIIFMDGYFKQKEYPESVLNYKHSLENCIEDKAFVVLKEFGENPYLTEGNLSVFFSNGNSRFEGRNAFKRRISEQLNEKINECVIFVSREYTEYEATVLSGEKIEVFFDSERVVFDIEFPVGLKSEGENYIIKDFKEVYVFVRLNEILDTAEKIIGKQQKNPESLCISCMGDFASENDVFIDISHYPEGKAVITIRDEKNKIANEFYELKFGVEV